MLLPIGLSYTLTARLNPLLKVLVGYCSLAILAGIGVTISKGGWFSTALALLLFLGVLFFQKRYRIPALVLVALLVSACLFFFPKSIFFRLRMKQLFTQNGKVNDELRYAVWTPTVHMWRDHPWYGVGPGHFNARFRAYRPEGIQMSPEYTHNDYLNTLADWGVVGTALVAGQDVRDESKIKPGTKPENVKLYYTHDPNLAPVQVQLCGSGQPAPGQPCLESIPIKYSKQSVPAVPSSFWGDIEFRVKALDNGRYTN
jgi:hypothetical protein